MRLEGREDDVQPMFVAESHLVTVLFAVSCHRNCKMPFKRHVQAAYVSTKHSPNRAIISRIADGSILYWEGTCGYGCLLHLHVVAIFHHQHS
jgi:hypothetical protein